MGIHGNQQEFQEKYFPPAAYTSEKHSQNHQILADVVRKKFKISIYSAYLIAKTDPIISQKIFKFGENRAHLARKATFSPLILRVSSSIPLQLRFSDSLLEERSHAFPYPDATKPERGDGRRALQGAGRGLTLGSGHTCRFNLNHLRFAFFAEFRPTRALLRNRIAAAAKRTFATGGRDFRMRVYSPRLLRVEHFTEVTWRHKGRHRQSRLNHGQREEKSSATPMQMLHSSVDQAGDCADAAFT